MIKTKKVLIYFLSFIIIVIVITLILNIKVSTKQGIDYQWRTKQIPLYLKILDFFDRHYNYKQLVRLIIADTKTEEERVMKIFAWTYKNLKKVPKGLPIIDDHVWYTIVRGYGVDDQFSDVFTTLCNYAGIEAFYLWVNNPEKTKRIPLSFVKIQGKWTVFDPYRGTYFKDEKGQLADIEILKSDKGWILEVLDKKPEIDYVNFISALSLIKNNELRRANLQSPINRLEYEIKKWLR